MPSPLTLAGAAVRLEPLTPAHAEALFAAASGPRDTFGLTLVPDTLESTRQYIASALTEQDAGRMLPFATVRLADDRVVGSTRFGNIETWAWPALSPLRREIDACEIGWTWLAEEAQRSAINTEAKFLMLRHAFEAWRVHRVQLKTDARNWRSRNAIERIGATLEGVLRNVQPAYDGEIRSSAMFSITSDEWPRVKAHLEARMAGRA